MTDNKRRMQSDAKSPHCLCQGELKRILKCEYLHIMYSINMLQHQLISKGDNCKSYLSFNSLKARVISLLTVYYNEEVIFRYEPSRNKNCLWWPCLLTDRDEMINLYRGPSIDASYQVSVHLAKRFLRRRFFLNRPIRNKNCLWWPCLLIDRDKMSNLYREPSIDDSYQVSVHLAERFQKRRLKCAKLTDDGCQVMAKAHIAFGKVS